MPTEETTREAKNTANEAKNTANNVTDKVTGAASEAKEKVYDMGHAAARKFDRQREKVADMAHDASNYIHDRNASDMMSDLGEAVKGNPVPSIIIAAVAGFFVGYSLASRD